MASGVCDVKPEIAPTKEKNPLPEYGELYRKRQLKNLNRIAGGYEVYKLKKRLKCQKKPLDDKCIPKEVILPFKDPPDSAGRYLQYQGHASKGKTLRSDVTFPGWLVELSDGQLQSLLDAKELLATGKPFCEIIDEFCQSILGFGGDLTEDDVVQILRRIPSTSQGLSFSHFMFIAGNPWYAKKKDVLQEPMPFTKEQCKEQEKDADDAKSTTSQNKKRKNVVERLYQLPKIAEVDNWPPPDPSKGEKSKEPSKNEQLFYSALLYLEMYDTMEAIRKMYLGGSSVPESRLKTLNRQQKTGFGVSDIGMRKFGFAEWDRPLPPLPKTSPYIADFPLVGKRMKYVLPNDNSRRSKVDFDPLFMTVKAPEVIGDAIKVTADSKRIKGILELLAAEGNCLALLPNVHFILHLSDTLMNKLVEVHGPDRAKIKARMEELKILKMEANSLFKRHGLPKEVSQIPELINFSDAIKLREICKQIRDQHWAYICRRKLEFREKAWKLMHVERIPCGNLRESFVYSFQIYVPEKSHLPIVHE